MVLPRGRPHQLVATAELGEHGRQIGAKVLVTRLAGQPRHRVAGPRPDRAQRSVDVEQQQRPTRNRPTADCHVPGTGRHANRSAVGPLGRSVALKSPGRRTLAIAPAARTSRGPPLASGIRPLPWQAAAPRGVHPCRREAARRSSSSQYRVISAARSLCSSTSPVDRRPVPCRYQLSACGNANTLTTLNHRAPTTRPGRPSRVWLTASRRGGQG